MALHAVEHRGISIRLACQLFVVSECCYRYRRLLSQENQRQFFIPRGFAHGFLVLSEEAIFIYKVDNAYVPQAEASIRFNDETIGIEWPIAEEQLLLSPKDKTAPSFRDATYFE